MTTGKLLATAGILLALVSLSFLPAAARSYTVTDLGTLGGVTSAAGAINNVGQVVGYAENQRKQNHAFLWSSDTGMVDLGLLHAGDIESSSAAINDSGTVVGTSGSYGFLWTQDSGMQDLGNLGGGYADALGINNLGQVVGFSGLPDGSRHAFLWTATSGMQDLGTLGGNTSGAIAINDAGQVVGFAYLPDNITQHAFIWTAQAGMQDLGTLGGSSSSANAINATGEATGWTTYASNRQVAFLWDTTHAMRSLGTFGTTATTNGIGLNESAEVVGLVVSHGYRGFLWTRSHGLQNLTDLIFPKLPYVKEANAINSVGEIVGSGSNNHAILLTPIK